MINGNMGDINYLIIFTLVVFLFFIGSSKLSNFISELKKRYQKLDNNLLKLENQQERLLREYSDLYEKMEEIEDKLVVDSEADDEGDNNADNRSRDNMDIIRG